MSLTVVSGYWLVPNKHSTTSFDTWFRSSLRIQAPYVFFGTSETIALVKPIRATVSAPTEYIELSLEEFHTAPFKPLFVTHPVHCPSAELNMIWNEKIFLMRRAAALNPFNTDWFAWVDAGICAYRSSPPPDRPWPTPSKLARLSKEKLHFTTSDSPRFDPRRVSPTSYYHAFAATAYILHASAINYFATLYDSYLTRFVPKRGTIYTEQVIWTYILAEHPDLFASLGHGYGAAVSLLY